MSESCPGNVQVADGQGVLIGADVRVSTGSSECPKRVRGVSTLLRPVLFQKRLLGLVVELLAGSTDGAFRHLKHGSKLLVRECWVFRQQGAHLVRGCLALSVVRIASE